MAQRVALEMRDELPVPHWKLVTGSEEGEALHDFFMERFPPFERKPGETTPVTSEQRLRLLEIGNALERLVVFKLGNRQMDEAVKIALPYAAHVVDEKIQGWYFSTRRTPAVSAQNKFDFYLRLFEQVPGLPVYRDFISAALSSGQEALAEEFLLKSTANPELPKSQLREFQERHVFLLESTDRIPEALALRKKILAEMEKITGSTHFEYALATAAIAAWVEDAETQRESLDRAVAFWEKMNDRWDRKNKINEFIRALDKGGRGGEVESFLMDWVAPYLKNLDDEDWYDTARVSTFMDALVEFYERNNRMADIITLFEEAPWWRDARDVLDLSWNLSFDKTIANAFYETGRVGEARKFLTDSMKRDHSHDWAYELLLKLAGDDLEAFIAEMDVLYARDAFEERPLIWKAEALRRLGRLDVAEETIRHALKVDPTDGESPPGDRVRAYAVLGAILEEQGKAGDAQFFKDVVRAVRIAEEGDELKELGLTQRSLDRFTEAEALFADAYCVQWRLAEQLREMGRIEEAQKHYEIAFERMPEQFGRVASLCFGCMRVFSGEQSVSAAEVVLGRLVATPPVRPAVYYLMGQLREEQKNFSEASEWYEKALEADPDYFDVLLRLYSLKDRGGREDMDWVAVQNQIIRLKPLGRDGAGDGADEILDWAFVWKVRNEAVKTLPPSLDALFPLTANVRRLEAAGKGVKKNNRFTWRDRQFMTANEMLARTRLLDKLESMDGEFLEKGGGH